MVGKTTLARLGAAGLALLTMTLPLTGPSAEPPAAPEERPLVVEVRVPPDAVLEVDGTRTQSTGPTRTFRSPPVAVGKTYTYTLTATWRGKTVTRAVDVRPDRRNTIDLRKELEVAFRLTVVKPAPPSSFTLATPPPLTLKPGEEKSITFTIRRDNFKGSVAVELSGLPRHLRVNAPANIPGDQDRGQAVVTAAKEAQPGTTTVTVRARGAEIDREVAFPLTVVNPPPPSSFTLATPPRLALKPGEEKSITFSIRRDNFKDAVGLTFQGVPEGVTLGKGTIAADQDRVTVTAAAGKDAAPGVTAVKVRAAGPTREAEVTLQLTVEKAPPPPAILSLDVPPALRLQPGDSKAVRVRVSRENFTGPVTVTFAGLPQGVTVEDVTIPEDKSEAEVQATAAAGAGQGTKEVQVVGTGGQARAAVKLKVTVKAAPSRPEMKAPSKPEPGPERKAEVTLTPRPEANTEPRPGPKPESSPEPRVVGAKLELDVADVVLQPGEVRYAEVRVKPKGAASFAGDPDVKLQGPADDKVQLILWSASTKTDPASHCRGYAVRAAPDAAEGNRQIKVLVTIGAVKTEGTLKITVKNVAAREPAPKPESNP